MGSSKRKRKGINVCFLTSIFGNNNIEITPHTCTVFSLKTELLKSIDCEDMNLGQMRYEECFERKYVVNIVEFH